MPYQSNTFKNCKVTIPLLFLQIAELFSVSNRFYESLNEQNRMCELSFPKSGHTFLITCTKAKCYIRTCVKGL